nr:unnamed protein product [Callosobruchus analis]CAI5864368.1 unnamed protein product [Callosobruchus analis]
MNFVWTRERSKEKQHDRGRERSNGGFLFQGKTSLRFSIFSVLRQLTEAIKQPGGSSKKLDCCPPGRISLL